MTASELWQAFIKKSGIEDCEYEAWAFGVDSDHLARLVLTSTKTATASAYPLYELENEPLPKENEYSVILDSNDNAICIIKTTRVDIVPFDLVSDQHAFKEGEGDRSLSYWREVHEKFFKECLAEAGLEFTHDTKVVCEEFVLVYSNLEVKVIENSQKHDIKLPNDPFSVFGKMIPKFDGKWSYDVEYFDKSATFDMCFPDEDYDFDTMCQEHTFIGAYSGDTCVGLAVLKRDYFKYMYLYDLKVSSAYRRLGVGKMLIDKAKEIAVSDGYNGIYLHVQDNNLAACLFYISCGFYIGGFDNTLYKGTSQEGKSDIILYIDA